MKKSLMEVLQNVDTLSFEDVDEIENLTDYEVSEENLWDYENLIVDWLQHPLTENRKKIFQDVFSLIAEFTDSIELSEFGKGVLQSVFNESNYSETLYVNCCFILQNNEFYGFQWLLSDSESFEILKKWIADYVSGNKLCPIVCDDLIVNRPCYFKTDIYLVNLRYYQGAPYYDVDNRREAQLYIFADAIEFIGDFHMSIPLQSLLMVKLEKDKKTYKCKTFYISDRVPYRATKIVSLCSRNNGNINLYCNDYVASMLLALIPQIIKGNIC